MNHFYSYILYKWLSEDFAIWRKEQKRLSRNLAMQKYRLSLRK